MQVKLAIYNILRTDLIHSNQKILILSGSYVVDNNHNFVLHSCKSFKKIPGAIFVSTDESVDTMDLTRLRRRRARRHRCV